MTLVLPAEQTQNRPIDARKGRFSVWSHRVALGVLLAATAVLYLWNLSASGWANAFYSAAVQAGSQNPTAMLFGSSDAANGITVDKTPAALWVMDLSVRLFGLNSWSILAPQALMGVAAVAVLYAAVRRVGGPGPALLAGAVLAATPVAALMFRFNNPDALLVLLLVVAGYCVTRAGERDASRWWLIGAGVAVGFGFLAKMAQAFLVLPGFAVAYLVAGGRSVGRRVLALAGAAAAMVVAGGWYLLLAEVWPAASRPYIGGSQHNSIIELTLGYNGFGRITGNETGGLGNLDHDVGPGRLFGFGMGLDIAWLLPAALICLAAGLWLTRRAPRTDATRAALLNWGGWLIVTAVVFSFAGGIVHSYYTVALAPAIAAVLGIGAHLLWRNRFRPWCAVALAGGVLLTVVLAAVLLSRTPDWLPWLRGAVAVGGVGAAALLVVVGRLPDGVARAVAALAVVSALAAPAAYSVATAATPHTGAIPSVGPGRGFAGGLPGLLSSPQPGAEVTATLARDAHRYRWTAAVVGSNNAAGYQLASGAPVLALGGFNGTDPSPTLEQFQRHVADGDVHWFIGGRSTLGFGRAPQSGSRAAADIAAWVQAHFRSQVIDGVTLYDLTEDPS